MIHKIWAAVAATLLGAALAVGVLAAPAAASQAPVAAGATCAKAEHGATRGDAAGKLYTCAKDEQGSMWRWRPAVTTSPSASATTSTSASPAATATTSTSASPAATATQLPVTGSSTSTLVTIGTAVFVVGAAMLLFGVAVRRRRVSFRAPE